MTLDEIRNTPNVAEHLSRHSLYLALAAYEVLELQGERRLTFVSKKC